MKAVISINDISIIDPAPIRFESLPRIGETIKFNYGVLKFSNGAKVDDLYFSVDTIVYEVNESNSYQAIIYLERQKTHRSQ